MDKRPKDMSLDELESLPEYYLFDYIDIKLPHPDYPNAIGSYIKKPLAKKGMAKRYFPDDLICFQDREGNIWGLRESLNGWEKVREGHLY